MILKTCLFGIKMVDDLIPMQNKVGREISESEIVAAIKYLKIQNKIVNQLEVSKVVGCHFTIHKQFVKKYKKLNKSR